MKTNKFLIGLAALAALIGLTATAAPAGYYGNSVPSFPPIIDSTATTNALVNFPVWPNTIAASTSVTNVTPIPVAGKDVSLQFSAAAGQTNGGIVIVQLGRSISGGSPTNAAGTGLKIDYFATVTNTLPANTATTQNTAIALFGPTLNQGYIGDGAVPVFYIMSITTPANVTLTNFQFYVNTQ